MSALARTIDKAILEVGPQYASTIGKYQWSLVPDSQLHAAKIALTKSDYISKIAANDPGSVSNAIIQAAILGVDLTEGKRQAYLLPRKNQSGNMAIFLQVGYKGVEAIHQRMGVIDRLTIRAVRKADEFEWSGDDQEKPSHNPGRFISDEDRGEIEGAFSITYFPDGSIHVMMAAISEIYEKHRDLSDSWKSTQKKKTEGAWYFPSPWESHEKSMVEKTMAYIAAKQWPANYRNEEIASKIVSTLHECDTADYVEMQSGYSQYQKEEFDNLIVADDSFGLELMHRYIRSKYSDEVWTNLYNSFEKGTKTKNKALVSEMLKTGFDINQIVMGELSAVNGDMAIVAENIEECLPITLVLLKKNLAKEQEEMVNSIMQ